MFGISLKHLNRYSEVLRVLIRHGLGYFFVNPFSLPKMLNLQEEGNPLKGDNLTLIGQHLRDAFAELGPTFVKLGQLASTRSDLIPKPIATKLAKLQDKAYPIPFLEIRRIIEQSLEIRLESVFREFQQLPAAAASIAQTHYAVLQSGEPVIVKVQRPLIEEVVQTDLEIFQNLVAQIEERFEWGKKYPIRKMFEEFSRTIKEELDFLNEGRNADEMARVTKATKGAGKNSNILIPRIFWNASHRHVLTMEYISGIQLNKILANQTFGDTMPYRLPILAERLSKALLQQVLVAGFFHGDPHPGNLLILPNEKIAFIDFGIVGRLSLAERQQLAALIIALIRGSNPHIVKSISQMGVIPKHVDQESLLKDISEFRERQLNVPVKQMDIGKLVKEFFEVVFRHGIHIPSQFILVGKTLLTLDGILKELDPNLDLAEQAIPYAQKIFREKYSPRAFISKLWRSWQYKNSGK